MSAPRGTFVDAAEPLFRLGPNHPAVTALRAAIADEVDALNRQATANGLSESERSWWSGAATHARDLLDDIDREVERRAVQDGLLGDM